MGVLRVLQVWQIWFRRRVEKWCESVGVEGIECEFGGQTMFALRSFRV